jgi:hypothetical protein
MSQVRGRSQKPFLDTLETLKKVAQEYDYKINVDKHTELIDKILTTAGKKEYSVEEEYDDDDGPTIRKGQKQSFELRY